MNIKQFLSKSFRLEKQINVKLEQIKRLRALSTKANTIYSDMPKTKNEHKLEIIIEKLINLENEVFKDLEELINIKNQIIKMIKSVKNEDFKMVLELRYLCFKRWEEIAYDLKYDLRKVFRINKKALFFLENVSKNH